MVTIMLCIQNTYLQCKKKKCFKSHSTAETNFSTCHSWVFELMCVDTKLSFTSHSTTVSNFSAYQGWLCVLLAVCWQEEKNILPGMALCAACCVLTRRKKILTRDGSVCCLLCADKKMFFLTRDGSVCCLLCADEKMFFKSYSTAGSNFTALTRAGFLSCCVLTRFFFFYIPH